MVVIVCIACFVLGMLAGVCMISLCKVASSTWDKEEEENPCIGCFGASFNDCMNCPVLFKPEKEGEKDEP